MKQSTPPKILTCICGVFLIPDLVRILRVYDEASKTGSILVPTHVQSINLHVNTADYHYRKTPGSTAY